MELTDKVNTQKTITIREAIAFVAAGLPQFRERVKRHYSGRSPATKMPYEEFDAYLEKLINYRSPWNSHRLN